MSSITTRVTSGTGATVKGAPLTNAELDTNFINLNTDKFELGGTYSAGTANGVAYLNGSKVLTTGSALTFDGTQLGVGATNSFSAIVLQARATGAGLGIINDATSNTGKLDFLSASTGGYTRIIGDGRNNGYMAHYISDAEQMRLTSTGMGIGTSSPANKLSVLRTGSGDAITWASSTGKTAYAYADGSGIGVFTGASVTGTGFYANDTSSYFATYIGGSEQMRLTSSLLSVVPSATIQGLTVGRGAGAVSTNTAVGASALAANTTGNYNTANGASALTVNTTGAFNAAFGASSLAANTTGSGNVSFGPYALATNISGTNNTAVGSATSGNSPLQVNTGSSNTAVGANSLASNTTASNNTAVGYQAGYANATGTRNVFMGFQAGYPSLGDDNTAIGYSAFNGASTTAINVTAVGSYALTTNRGSYNTAHGAYSLYSNTTASNNTAVGYQAGYSGTTAADSTYLGFSAGYSLTTGTRNTLVGFYTGSAITTGTFNNFFGTQAGQAVTTGGKNTILGSYNGNQGGLDIRTASNYIVLSDGDGNPRQIIDSSGNLGLGVTPSAWGGSYKAIQTPSGAIAGFSTTSFDVYGNAYDSGAGTWKYQNSSQGATRYALYNGQHQWFNAPTGTAGNAITFTQAMTLDSSGNLGIGTTSPTKRLQVESGSTATGGQAWSHSAGTVYARIGIVNPGTSNDTEFGTVSNNDLRLITNNTERARIDSSGNLLVGTTTYNDTVTGILGSASGKLYATASAIDVLSLNRLVSDGAIATFKRSNTTVGSVSVTTTATAYNTSSDYRLKNSVVPMTGALAKVVALNPVTYKWNVDDSDGEGFIAHELAEVCPHAVSGEKDAVDEDGKPKYQGIDTSFLVATLTAAIQEQQALIESLTTRLAALEAK